MDMSGGMGGYMPLNDSGVDFSNETQAFDFLQMILDDSQWQVDGNYYARCFWYGVCVIIGITGIFNLIQVLDLKMRFVVAFVH